MRLTCIPLAALLFACTTQPGNTPESNTAEEADPLAPAEAPILGNDSAPAPQQPGAPSPGQPGQAEPEPVNSVTLRVSPGTLAAGETANLTLANGSRQQIGYNLCTSAIETPAGRPVRSDRVCTMELRTLGSGRNSTYSYELPDSIARGTYRFSTSIEWMGSGRRIKVTSNTFQVQD